jgi:hypothetical protein
MLSFHIQWNDGRIIALLVLAFTLLSGFVMVQVLLPKTATIAPRIFMQRSVLAGFFSTLCIGAHMMLFCELYKHFNNMTGLD